MNMDFLKTFMERTDFPAEAREFLLPAAEKVDKAAMEETVKLFYDSQFSMSRIEPNVNKMAEEAGLSPYTVWLFTLIEASVLIRDVYLARGESEQLFYDTFSDLKYKVIECKNIHDVWGNFVAFWYPIFYSRQIVKLGRLEYETCVFSGSPITTGSGHAVLPGDTAHFIHIPSSGEPFDQAARLDSYKRAYEYFKPTLNGGPLICLCHSWLLYPPYGEILPEGSNFKSFQKDFELVQTFPSEEFGDDWRLFGKDCKKPTAELPENTSMQRAFKKYFLAGGKPGSALGVLVFDGEKLVR